MVEIKGSDKQTITALVPAFNEENNIARCIKSVLWCDRILVLWMGDDQTGVIARQLGAEVILMNQNERPDFTLVQKNINWAIDHATTDWILRIDADEEVTQELKEEIKVTVATGGSCERDPGSAHDRSTDGNETTDRICCEDYVAFKLPRNQYFLGAFLKGGDWYYDCLVRLFRPQCARYEPIVAVHEQFRVKGKIGHLHHRLNHYSHPRLKDVVEKFQRYTDAEAKTRHEGKCLIAIKMVLMPIYVFGRWFVWHHGYRDGWRGLLAGIMRGWYEFLLYSKSLFRSNQST